ncbi:MAG: hypothetical protein WCO19_04630 [Candidatus Saccharibacteria bacterium]
MNKIKLIVSMALVAPFLSMAPVLAATTPAPATTKTTTTTPAPTAKPAATTLADRIAKNKATYAATLSAADQAKLKLKCKVAQIKGKAFAVTLTDKVKTRTENYTKITTALSEVIADMKTAGTDTKAIEAAQTELTTLIASYTADVATYQTAIADLNDVDCIVDPAGFKGALEGARAARVVIAKDVKDIRVTIETKVLPLLKTENADSMSPGTMSTPPPPTTTTKTGGTQ